MTRQTRTTAAVAACVLLLHLGVLWALQSGLLARPATVVPPAPLLARLVPAPAPAPAPPPMRVQEAAVPPAAPPAGEPAKSWPNRVPVAQPPVRKPVPAQPTDLPAPTPAPAPTPSPAPKPKPTPDPSPAAAEPTPPSATPTPVPNAAPTIQTGTAADTGRRRPSETTGTPRDVASPSGGGGAPDAPSAPHAATTVELPSSEAQYLQNPRPRYPPISRRLLEEGTVLVDVFVSDQGLAREAKVRTSSGFFRLDNAAVSTVLTWRFVPGKRAGVPQSMWHTVPVIFQIQ